MARRPKLETAANAYLDALAAAGRADRTITTYRGRLNDFISWAAKHRVKTVAKLNDRVVAGYLEHLYDRGLHSKTRATAESVLQCWSRWMVGRAWLTDSMMPPSRSRKRCESVPRAVLTVGEVERVLDAVPLDTYVGIRDRAILEVLYSSALRLAELVALRLVDVDAEAGVLLVTGKGNKERVVPIGERGLFWLDRYVAEQRPLHTRRRDPGTVFVSRQGNAMCQVSVRERVRVALQRAGISKHATPHCWRHTAATVLLEGGMGVRYVQELLGHAAAETTTQYTRVTIEHLKAEHGRTHPLPR